MEGFPSLHVRSQAPRLKVITELVVNHTSDQHSWFKRARRSSPGSDARNWYVWSDNDQKNTAAPASFSPIPKSRTGPGMPEAGAYYWHRFFSHQPDLNYDNPRVLFGDHPGDAPSDRHRRGWIPSRCDSLPVRTRGHQQRKLAGDPRGHQADPCRAEYRHRQGCCSLKRTSGRKTSARISAMAMNATWRITSR